MNPDQIKGEILDYLREELDRLFQIRKSDQDLRSLFEACVDIHLPEDEEFYPLFLQEYPRAKEWAHFAGPHHAVREYLIHCCRREHQTWTQTEKSVEIRLSNGTCSIQNITSPHG